MLWFVIAAAALTVLAGLLAAVDAALSSFSRARARELVEEERAGATRLLRILDEPARYLNCVLLLRVICETAAVVFGTLLLVGFGYLQSPWWLVAGALVMAFISYVAIGVGPRTLGRQHAESVALASAAPVIAAEWLL